MNCDRDVETATCLLNLTLPTACLIFSCNSLPQMLFCDSVCTQGTSLSSTRPAEFHWYVIQILILDTSLMLALQNIALRTEHVSNKKHTAFSMCCEIMLQLETNWCSANYKIWFLFTAYKEKGESHGRITTDA